VLITTTVGNRLARCAEEIVQALRRGESATLAFPAAESGQAEQVLRQVANMCQAGGIELDVNRSGALAGTGGVIRFAPVQPPDTSPAERRKLALLDAAKPLGGVAHVTRILAALATADAPNRAATETWLLTTLRSARP